MGIKIKKCFKCGKEINKEDNYISLISYNLGEIIEQCDFHLICWGDYNNDRLQKRMFELAKKGMDMLKL
jgi:hypothetical protein